MTHAATTPPEPDVDIGPDIVVTDEERGREVFDRRARERLGISGEEFIRRYQAGDLDDLDHSEAFPLPLPLMLPLAGNGLDGRPQS